MASCSDEIRPEKIRKKLFHTRSIPTVKQLLLLYPFWGELFYVEHQSLEVFAFRMVDVDRMVARLGELVKDAHAASALCSGGKHGVTEVLLVHHLRTGEGKEDAARTYLFEGLGIEFGVTAKGIAQGIAVLGKGRRVEDNQVVLVAHAVEELEGIFRKGLVTGYRQGS